MDLLSQLIIQVGSVEEVLEWFRGGILPFSARLEDSLQMEGLHGCMSGDYTLRVQVLKYEVYTPNHNYDS